MEKSREAIIVGGGFYGLRIALFLNEIIGLKNIVVIEKESSTMTRASYVNQARVHNGYHYPRSLLTAHRSRVNFPSFVQEYEKAIKSDFIKYYALASSLSKVNAHQFEAFAHKIGADITHVGEEFAAHFNPRMLEKVFVVKEYAFDSHKLRDDLLERIKNSNAIKVVTGEEVVRVAERDGVVEVKTDKKSYIAQNVFNCTYSQINKLHRNSGLPLVALKHEITEMCLIDLPQKLKDLSITVMDGPFFSIMPFPSTPHSTLSHVRYTPHTSWVDNESVPPEKHDPHAYFRSLNLRSNYKQMLADVQRFLPEMRNAKYARSLWEVKTVLQKSEHDDSRPILFRSDFGLKGYTCIMGGKLDNIYDVFEGLASLYGKKEIVA